MKIVFICGCLEPGMDGVGDYVQRIAGTLKTKGHQVTLIALKDKYVQFLLSDVEKNDIFGVSVYRIPAIFSMRRRYSIISKIIEELKPDWISLQYVGFSYERYGLPLEMPFYLRNMARNSKLQIMLHELWCGMDKFSKSTEQVLGVAQKLFLKSLITIAKPNLIFTSIEFYKDELSSLGIKSIVTPVFGNIPLYEFGPDDTWNKYTYESELQLITKNLKDWLIITFFGTVYPCPGLDRLLNSALEAAKNENQSLAVISIGNNRLNNLEETIKSFQNTKYFSLGMLPFEKINRIFNLTTLGVLTSPANRLNKSGSAIAMLERGIPILISPLDKTYSLEMEKGGIHQVIASQNVLSALDQRGSFSKRSDFSMTADSYSNLDAFIKK
jgi:hypothetical protein